MSCQDAIPPPLASTMDRIRYGVFAQEDSNAGRGVLEKCSAATKKFSPNCRVLEAATYALEGAPEKAIPLNPRFQSPP